MERSFDYIIVGAGSAGCALASRLAEDRKVSVLVIEPGSDVSGDFRTWLPGAFLFAQGSSMDWAYVTEKQPGTYSRKHAWPMGRALGGSSAINALMFVRGHPEDYNRWEYAFNCPGWGYDNLLPYFKQLEDASHVKTDPPLDPKYRGTTGPIKITVDGGATAHPLSVAFVRAAESMGLGAGEHGLADASRSVIRSGAGKDYNAETPFGASLTQHTAYDGVRQSAFKGFLQPRMDRTSPQYRPNLTVVTGVLVTRVVVDDKSPVDGPVKVIGVECARVDKFGKEVKNSKRIIVRCNREVVLSAGAVGSPKILLLSGIGAQQDVQPHGIMPLVHLPGVGKNLQDHLMVSVFWENPSVESENPDTLVGIYNTIAGYVKSSKKGALLHGGVESIAFFTTERYVKEQLELYPGRTPPQSFEIEYLPGTVPSILNGNFLHNTADFRTHAPAKLKGKELDAYVKRQQANGLMAQIAKPFGRGALPPGTFMLLLMQSKPRSTGFVKLRSANPSDAPVIDPQYFSDPHDIEEFIDGYEVTRQIMQEFNRKFPKLCGKEVVDEASAETVMIETGLDREAAVKSRRYMEEIIRRATITNYHPVGTCKMGPKSDPAAVVDPETLRVHGFANLRVADASIMPDVIGGNTNATSIVIGLRAADLIKNETTNRARL